MHSFIIIIGVNEAELLRIRIFKAFLNQRPIAGTVVLDCAAHFHEPVDFCFSHFIEIEIVLFVESIGIPRQIWSGGSIQYIHYSKPHRESNGAAWKQLIVCKTEQQQRKQKEENTYPSFIIFVEFIALLELNQLRPEYLFYEFVRDQ